MPPCETPTFWAATVSCQVNVPAVLLLDTFLSRARDPASVFERARIDNIGARRDEAERTIRRVYLATAEMAERAVKRDLRLNRRVRVVRFVLQRVERSQAARHLVRPDERCAVSIRAVTASSPR